NRLSERNTRPDQLPGRSLAPTIAILRGANSARTPSSRCSGVKPRIGHARCCRKSVRQGVVLCCAERCQGRRIEPFPIGPAHFIFYVGSCQELAALPLRGRLGAQFSLLSSRPSAARAGTHLSMIPAARWVPALPLRARPG